jgi:hypothetical protein
MEYATAKLVLSAEDVREKLRRNGLDPTLKQCSDWIEEHGDDVLQTDTMMETFWLSLEILLEKNPIAGCPKTEIGPCIPDTEFEEITRNNRQGSILPGMFIYKNKSLDVVTGELFDANSFGRPYYSLTKESSKKIADKLGVIFDAITPIKFYDETDN